VNQCGISEQPVTRMMVSEGLTYAADKCSHFTHHDSNILKRFGTACTKIGCAPLACRCGDASNVITHCLDIIKMRDVFVVVLCCLELFAIVALMDRRSIQSPKFGVCPLSAALPLPTYSPTFAPEICHKIPSLLGTLPHKPLHPSYT